MTQLVERGDPTVAPAAPPPPTQSGVEHQPDRPRVVASRPLEDWLTLGGSGVGSLCLVWLLYEQVLPFSGKIGFVLCWFVVFLLMYAIVTAVTHPLPIVVDRIAGALLQAGAAVVGGAVLWAVFYTLQRGWPAYTHTNFFTQDMSASGPLNPLTQGGIKHAIVGSLIELGIAVAISMPLGLATAVFMNEVGGRFAKIVRTVVEAMTALPDLVAGLFVYAFVILSLGGSQDGMAAAIALSITMLPIIARSGEVVLRIVPGSLREASLALGSSQWRTVYRVVLPTARSGLGTALILGMARGIGESAPVLIVSAPSAYFNANPFHNPMNSLPLFAINGLRAPDQNSITRGWGAACVLLVLVIVLFLVVRVLARERRGTR